MDNVVIYAHDKSDVESSIIKVCTCSSEEIANNIVDALEFRDTGGRKDGTGLYEYYIKKKGQI